MLHFVSHHNKIIFAVVEICRCLVSPAEVSRGSFPRQIPTEALRNVCCTDTGDRWEAVYVVKKTLSQVYTKKKKR